MNFKKRRNRIENIRDCIVHTKDKFLGVCVKTLFQVYMHVCIYMMFVLCNSLICIFYCESWSKRCLKNIKVKGKLYKGGLYVVCHCFFGA